MGSGVSFLLCFTHLKKCHSPLTTIIIICLAGLAIFALLFFLKKRKGGAGLGGNFSLPSLHPVPSGQSKGPLILNFDDK